MLLLFGAAIRCNPSRWRPFYLSPEITDKTTFGAKLECNLLLSANYPRFVRLRHKFRENKLGNMFQIAVYLYFMLINHCVLDTWILLYIYFPSTKPLLYLYFTSTDHLQHRKEVAPNSVKECNYSQLGNITFPAWERNIPSLGINVEHRDSE